MSNQNPPPNPPEPSSGSAPDRRLILLALLVLVLIIIVALLGTGALTNTPPATYTPTPNPTVTATAPPVAGPMDPRNGHRIISLGFPSALKDQVNKALTALKVTSDATVVFDSTHIVYHFTSDKSVPDIAALPIKDSLTTVLGATGSKTIYDFVTPDDQKDAQIVGSLYAPSIAKSAMILAVVPNVDKILQPRLYDVNGARITSSLSVLMRKFVGVPIVNASADLLVTSRASTMVLLTPIVTPPAVQPSDGDAGAIISARETCFTVGLDQMCLELPLTDKAADTAASTAYDNLSKTFSSIGRDAFDLNGSVLDLLGDAQHIACAKDLANYPFDNTTTSTVSACAPTADWIALTSTPPVIATVQSDYHVIGILSVQKMTSTGSGLLLDTQSTPGMPPGPSQVYDDKKLNSVGALPVDDYLVLAPTIDPATGKPVLTGAAVPIMLIGTNKTTYYIPGLKVEAFGVTNTSGAPSALQAFVKDGGAGGYWQP